MALLDVNALVALAWDSHIHHARIREWFTANATLGWATCPLTEAGFVRVSTKPKSTSQRDRDRRRSTGPRGTTRRGRPPLPG